MNKRLAAFAGTVRRIIRRFLCVTQGHPCEATGRRGYALREWRCQRCGGVFISHSDYGRALLPATPDSDEMLIRHMEAIRPDALAKHCPHYAQMFNDHLSNSSRGRCGDE